MDINKVGKSFRRYHENWLEKHLNDEQTLAMARSLLTRPRKQDAPPSDDAPGNEEAESELAESTTAC